MASVWAWAPTKRFLQRPASGPAFPCQHHSVMSWWQASISSRRSCHPPITASHTVSQVILSSCHHSITQWGKWCCHHSDEMIKIMVMRVTGRCQSILWSHLVPSFHHFSIGQIFIAEASKINGIPKAHQDSDIPIFWGCLGMLKLVELALDFGKPF